jgi:carbonic anhydrase
MKAYQEFFEYNRKWVASRNASDPDFFSKLSEGQYPGFLYIGCCDSRVPAEEVTGARPGELFVHRNIANLVHPSDPNAMAVIEYAVSQLQVRHIVVCGHYLCGGVKASMEPRVGGALDPWLDQIREVAGVNREELNRIPDEEQRYHRLVEINVVAQCRNVASIPVVRDSFRSMGLPKVHGWVFDIRNGDLIDLKFKP